MPSKTKICFVVAVDITLRLILLEYLRLFKQAGYDVWVVCSPSPYLQELEKEGFKVKAIPISRKIQPLADLKAFFQLVTFFKREQFALVQVQTPKAAFLGQLAAKKAKVPVIINNNFGFYFHTFSALKKKFFVFFEKLAARGTSLMFSINKEDMVTAAKEGIFKPEQIRYLGFGIDVEKFNPVLYPADFVAEKKRQLGIAPEKKVVGIIARLVEEKGYPELFSAFKQVLEAVPQALLMVVGIAQPEKKDAVDMAAIKNYGIEENVLFLGDRKDIAQLYTVMDVFVLPTRREGLGNTILEASAMEKPVVATDVRGCRESVENGKTGLLFPLKNSEKLAEALVYLLQNPEVCAAMGKAGRIRVKEQFSQEIVFARMKSAYEELLG